jgi:hypothetical protein
MEPELARRLAHPLRERDSLEGRVHGTTKLVRAIARDPVIIRAYSSEALAVVLIPQGTLACLQSVLFTDLQELAFINQLS